MGNKIRTLVMALIVALAVAPLTSSAHDPSGDRKATTAEHDEVAMKAQHERMDRFRAAILERYFTGAAYGKALETAPPAGNSGISEPPPKTNLFLVSGIPPGRQSSARRSSSGRDPARGPKQSKFLRTLDGVADILFVHPAELLLPSRWRDLLYLTSPLLLSTVSRCAATPRRALLMKWAAYAHGGPFYAPGRNRYA